MCSGSASRMVIGAIDSKKLSEKEIEEIREYLNMVNQPHNRNPLKYTGTLLILLTAALSAAWFDPGFAAGTSFNSEPAIPIEIYSANENTGLPVSPEGKIIPSLKPEEQPVPINNNPQPGETHEKSGKESGSGDFRRDLKQLQEDIREQFDSEEFLEQMKKLREELRAKFDSEEFREQMRQLQDEARIALEKRGMHNEQRRQDHEERRKAREQRKERHEEMKQFREQTREAIEQLREQLESEEFRQRMRQLRLPDHSFL